MRSQFGRGRQLWMSIVMLLIAVWIGPQAHAGCGKRVAVAKVATKIKANHSTTAFVLTPIAFPVFVVAQPAVLYGYDRRAVADGSRYGSARRSNGPTSGDFKSDTLSSSASGSIARSCVACHGGTAPKAGLDLTHLELTPDQRLQAVARVVSDDPTERMPPGQPLSPSEIGRVLQELSQRRSIAADDP